MIRPYIALVCSTLALLLGTPAVAQETRSLLEIQTVSGGLEPHTQEVSIADHIYAHYLRGSKDAGDHIAFAVYNLNAQYTRLTGALGVADDDTNADDGPAPSYRIAVDGTVQLEGTLTRNQPPVLVDLDLTGARSLRIVLSPSAVCAAPLLTVLEKPVPGVPHLVFPKDGGTLSNTHSELLWEPVKGAVSYGVSLVCTHLAPHLGIVPSVFAFNSAAPHLRLTPAILPPGSYHWSVVAFGRKGPLGSFSRAWSFEVGR